MTKLKSIAAVTLLLFLGAGMVSCSSSKPGSTDTNPLLQLLADSSLHHAHTGILVQDAASGKVLIAHQADRYFVPASNTKLFTLYAALKHLPDSLLAGTMWPQADGSAFFSSAADPTFLHPDFANHKLASTLKTYPQVYWLNPTLQTTAYGNGWSWNDYEATYMAPRSSFPIFGQEATFSLRQGKLAASPPQALQLIASNSLQATDTGFSISRGFETATFDLKPGRITRTNISLYPTTHTLLPMLSSTLGNRWQIANTASFYANSPGVPIYATPTDSMLKPLMHNSDNFFAEQTLLMISHQWWGLMNERNVIDSILKTNLAKLPQRPRWVDGSGLSRYNLFTPQSIVWLLQQMHNEFGLPRLQNILPIGNKGTLTNYYTNLTGKIFAKTGTLSGVVALSGYLTSRHGRLLYFSTLVNNHTGAATAVRRAIERFLVQIWNTY